MNILARLAFFVSARAVRPVKPSVGSPVGIDRLDLVVGGTSKTITSMDDQRIIGVDGLPIDNQQTGFSDGTTIDQRADRGTDDMTVHLPDGTEIHQFNSSETMISRTTNPDGSSLTTIRDLDRPGYPASSTYRTPEGVESPAPEGSGELLMY